MSINYNVQHGMGMRASTFTQKVLIIPTLRVNGTDWYPADTPLTFYRLRVLHGEWPVHDDAARRVMQAGGHAGILAHVRQSAGVLVCV